jgi:hypothetical protein
LKFQTINANNSFLYACNKICRIRDKILNFCLNKTKLLTSISSSSSTSTSTVTETSSESSEVFIVYFNRCVFLLRFDLKKLFKHYKELYKAPYKELKCFNINWVDWLELFI